MEFNRFRIQVVIRVLLLLFCSLLLTYLLFRTHYHLISVGVVLLILYQTFQLISLVEKTNRQLVQFFKAMENRDFTQSSGLGQFGSTFRELAESFTKISQRFSQLRSEKEEHYLYLQTVVQHVGIAVVSFKEDGEVGLINQAALQLFQVTQVKNINMLEGTCQQLVRALFELKIGESKLLKLDTGLKPQHLLMSATGFKLHGEIFKLVSIQNIQNEIEREQIGRELEIARHVQQTLLPRKKPSLDNFDIAGICLPAREVGGDYFDYILNEGSKIGIVVGDVSGKGVPAAIYMTLTKGIIQSSAGKVISPQQSLVKLNNFLYKTMDRNSFVTMAYAVLDNKDRSIQIARAGHLPLIYYHSRNDEILLLKPSGIGLGLATQPVFKRNLETVTINLSPGDWFIFYTDGITEARDNNQVEFGEERLISCFKENLHSSAQEMINTICARVQEFSKDNEQHDDMTMVLIKAV
jgi:serine phosphatase RsbU (regulator of sigma subunit)